MLTKTNPIPSLFPSLPTHPPPPAPTPKPISIFSSNANSLFKRSFLYDILQPTSNQISSLIIKRIISSDISTIVDTRLRPSELVEITNKFQSSHYICASTVPTSSPKKSETFISLKLTRIKTILDSGSMPHISDLDLSSRVSFISYIDNFFNSTTVIFSVYLTHSQSKQTEKFSVS